MLCRLPPYATEKWRDEADFIDQNQSRLPNFEDFVGFVERLVRVNGMVPWYGKQLFPDTGYYDSKETKVKTMAVSNASSTTTCAFCKEIHDTAECKRLSDLPSEEKQRFVIRNGLCFGCLVKGHMSAKCLQRKKCKIFDGRHPTSLNRQIIANKGDVVPLHVRSTHLPVSGCKLHVVPVLVTWGTKTVENQRFPGFWIDAFFLVSFTITPA